MVDEATIGPGGVDAATAAIREEAIPRFRERAGAVEGLWLVDRVTGRLLTVTIWTSGADPGADAGQVASVVGLRPTDLGDGDDQLWARVTRVEGLASSPRSALEDAHADAVLDQSRSEGFCGSCWLGDERTGTGLGLSLWAGPHALIRGEHASKRRRHELADRLGVRVTNVAELECLGLATPPGDARL